MTVTTTCPRCSAPTSPEHRFCEGCGTNLRWASTPCVACGADGISDEGECLECGSAQPLDRDRIELELRAPTGPSFVGGPSLVGSAPPTGGAPLAGGVSDRGHRRQRNEDAMACGHAARDNGRAVVAVVCDGVASVERGDEAAQVAVRVASDVLLHSVGPAPDLGRATVDAVREAARAVARLALRPDDGTGPADAGSPSSTLVSAVVTAEEVVLGWVGDSRAYWLGERSALLTADHALGGVLTRWLGADAGEVTAQVNVFHPDGPGVVLVCSDGLWNYLPDPEDLAVVALPAAHTDPVAAAAALTQRALDAGGRDNITLVLVPFPPAG
jgi:serine/threonine protein phosphatase PrpC